MRKRAAAVPASKAEIGEIYAVEHEGKLTRFRVDRITTHRFGSTGSPHDYRSEIGGQFLLGTDDSGNGLWSKPVTITPERLKGRYEEYQELVTQRDAENAAREAKKNADEARRTRLLNLLYDKTGIAKPNDDRSYYHPFRIGTSEVEVLSIEAMDKLIAILERVKTPKAEVA